MVKKSEELNPVPISTRNGIKYFHKSEISVGTLKIPILQSSLVPLDQLLLMSTSQIVSLHQTKDGWDVAGLLTEEIPKMIGSLFLHLNFEKKSFLEQAVKEKMKKLISLLIQ